MDHELLTRQVIRHHICFLLGSYCSIFIFMCRIWLLLLFFSLFLEGLKLSLRQHFLLPRSSFDINWIYLLRKVVFFILGNQDFPLLLVNVISMKEKQQYHFDLFYLIFLYFLSNLYVKKEMFLIHQGDSSSRSEDQGFDSCIIC